MSHSVAIPRRKLSHEVLERLTNRIQSGEFVAGDQLPSERDLMELYGVGRPAIREALQSLERAGIVTITHGERARVAVPTPTMLIEQIAGGARHLLRTEPDTLDHLKDARLFLEVGMAQRAAERADAVGVQELERLLALHAAAMPHAKEAGDRDLFLDRDMAFHRQIAAMTDNPIFPALVEAMFDWLGEYYRVLVRAPGAEDLTITEHRRILDAIAARDSAAAGAAMHDHLTRANALYRLRVKPD